MPTKCNSHPYEQGPGVCAPCLHDRLLALLAAHNRPHLTPIHHHHHHHNPDPSPPPLLSASSRHYRRFFSAPQSGPAAGGGGGGGGRFPRLSYLLSHRRSEEKEPDSVPSEDSKLGSWFRALIRGWRRRKSSRLFTAAEEVVPRRATAPYGVSNRGMSPAAVEESECGSESGYSTASSGAWRMPTPSPMRRAAARHRRHHHHHHGGGGSVTGFSVCLSPLVWASPGRRRGQTPEFGFSSELCSSSNSLYHHHHHHHHHHPHHRHAPGGAALAPSRSRKLADFGRFR